MESILIVDDELKIREVISEYVKSSGYDTFEASDGIQALKIVETQPIDLVILDVMMPNLDGFTTCKRIKEMKNIPIIMLSARSEEYDKLLGFDLGIDDYVTKPFSLRELLARIKVVLDRYRKDTKDKVHVFEGLVVDTAARTISTDGEMIKVTPKEFDLLIYLIDNKGIALSRERFLEEVWDYNYYGDFRTVDTHVKMLRHNLGEYRKFIVTVRGMGYKFEV